MNIRYKTLIRYKHNHESNFKCHLLLLLIGVGHILDGLILVCSLGFFTGGFAMECARKLSLERLGAK